MEGKKEGRKRPQIFQSSSCNEGGTKGKGRERTLSVSLFRNPGTWIRHCTELG